AKTRTTGVPSRPIAVPTAIFEDLDLGHPARLGHRSALRIGHELPVGDIMERMEEALQLGPEPVVGIDPEIDREHGAASVLEVEVRVGDVERLAPRGDDEPGWEIEFVVRGPGACVRAE